MRKILRLHVYLLLSIALVACAGCKGKSSDSDQASVFPRGGQAIEIDRFEEEIAKFEEADKAKMPAKDAILFVGSSSIRLWSDLGDDFAPLPVINRGFGGSTIPEVMYYAKRIVWKYSPRLIVFYCGENDIAESTAPAIVFQNFKKFIGETEKNLPNTTVIFISAKPSPQRWSLWRDFQQLNAMVEQFAQNRPTLKFADIRGALLGADGQPNAALFTEDKLHLNRAGYEKWVEILKPLVTEVYEKAGGAVR
jgi:lysophospholipase L1-like esterase